MLMLLPGSQLENLNLPLPMGCFAKSDAASAAGFTAHGAPVVRTLPTDGVTALFALEGCHMAVHTFPERGVLLLDVLASAAHADAQRAVDVFARRIGGRPRTAQHFRG